MRARWRNGCRRWVDVAGGYVVAGDAAIDGLDILGARAALQVDAAD